MPEEIKEVIGADGRIDTSKQEPEVIPQSEPDPKEIKVEETEKEEKEEPVEINFNDFLATKGEEVKEEPPKKEEEIKKEEVVEVTPGDKPLAKDKKKEERDVSDLDEPYQPLFKKDMSNEAYRLLKPIVKEHKVLKEQLAAKDTEIANMKKGAIPESYYDNEKAILLVPEFESLNNASEEAQAISDHWRKQLVAVRRGDNKFKFLSKNKAGEYVLEDRNVTDDTETELESILSFANNQTQRIQGKLESLVEGHKAKVTEYTNTVKDLAKKTFPIFDDPEKGKDLRVIVADTISKFPAVFRTNPMAEVLARSLVTNHKLADMLRSLSAAKTPDKKGEVKNDKKRSGPTAGELTGGGKNEAPEITIDDFERVKNG